MQFLALIVGEKKSLLRHDEVKRLNVPHWPELGIVNVWMKYSSDATFMKYMPPVKHDPSKEIECKYFWGIACTLHPGFTDGLIREAQNKRL